MAYRPSVLLLGAPLVGKGTLAQLLVSAYPDSLTWWESSAILKEYARTHDDERAAAVKAIFSGEAIVSAKLLDDSDLVTIIRGHAEATDSDLRTRLLDGVVRTPRQAGLLQQTLSIKAVVVLDDAGITDEELARRVAQRNRPGETLEQARERIRIYNEKTAPLIAWYESVSPVIRVDGSKDISWVYREARLGLRDLCGLDY